MLAIPLKLSEVLKCFVYHGCISDIVQLLFAEKFQMVFEKREATGIMDCIICNVDWNFQSSSNCGILKNL
jgi:hypothetical protein